MVEHEVTGLVAPKGDPEALCSHMDRLLDDDDFRSKLGSNAKEFAKKHWDMDQAVSKVLNVYENVTETGSDVK